MSLVSEALRKARARAADGAAATPTVPPTLALPPRRYRPGFGAVALVLVGAAAAAGGAAGVWWALGRQRPEPHAAAAPAPLAAEPAVPASPAGAPAESAVDGAVAGGSTTVASRDGASAGPPVHAVTPPLDTADDAPAVTPEPAPFTTPAATRQPVPATEAAAGERAADGRIAREVLIDADLGYAKLHLDYLVFRPGSPFGRVNGQDVIVGTTVDGFRVDEITADYVRLSDRRNVVTLRVR